MTRSIGAPLKVSVQGTLPFTLLVLDLFSHYHTRCLSILALSDSLPSILTRSGSLPVYSHTITLAACLFLHYQTHCRLFSHDQALCLSILTRSGSLPVYSLTLTACLFSYSQAHCLCILALSGSQPSILSLLGSPPV